MSENTYLIEALHLTTPSDNPKVQDAREQALKYLSSKAPIPQTLLRFLEQVA